MQITIGLGDGVAWTLFVIEWMPEDELPVYEVHRFDDGAFGDLDWEFGTAEEAAEFCADEARFEHLEQQLGVDPGDAYAGYPDVPAFPCSP